VAKDLIPLELANRPKQPYRAPISRCFLGKNSNTYVEDLLSESSLIQSGYFHPGRVSRLLEKCRRQDGFLLSERENMALVGIISTQLLDDMFVRNFPGYAIHEPQNIKVVDRRADPL
jgi:asparagine synthase (glutamine-hydrolysing)